MIDISFLQKLQNFLAQPHVIKAGAILLVMALGCAILSLGYRKLCAYFSSEKQPIWIALLHAAYKPAMCFLALLGMTYSIEWFCFAWSARETDLFDLIRRISFIALFAWFLLNLVAQGKAHFLLREGSASKSVDKTFIYAVSQITRIVIIIASLLSLLQVFGFSLAGVLAFGGMGGLIIGFASKDLFANIFGSLLLFLDRPFAIGDYIALPSLKVEGEVKAIGWRVCEILAPTCRPVYVPNALFSSLVVENRSRIDRRRHYFNIKLRYQDKHRIEALTTQIRELLLKRESIDTTRTILVNLTELTDTSLSLLVSATSRLTTASEFFAVQQQLYLEILACIEQAGAKWAFPTSEVHLREHQKD